MNKSLLHGSLSLALPLFILAGCSGGGSGIATPTATPGGNATATPTASGTAVATATTAPGATATTAPTATPTTRPTATSTPVPNRLFSVNIPLTEGPSTRIGIFTVSRVGSVATGTLVVPARNANTPTISLDPGTYPLVGTFTEPRSVSLSGNLRATVFGFPNNVPFSFSGTLPSCTESGNVVFNVNNSPTPVTLAPDPSQC